MNPWNDPTNVQFNGRYNSQDHPVNRGRLTIFDFAITGLAIGILGIGFLVGFLRHWLGW